MNENSARLQFALSFHDRKPRVQLDIVTRRTKVYCTLCVTANENTFVHHRERSERKSRQRSGERSRYRGYRFLLWFQQLARRSDKQETLDADFPRSYRSRGTSSGTPAPWRAAVTSLRGTRCPGPSEIAAVFPLRAVPGARSHPWKTHDPRYDRFVRARTLQHRRKSSMRTLPATYFTDVCGYVSDALFEKAS